MALTVRIEFPAGRVFSVILVCTLQIALCLSQFIAEAASPHKRWFGSAARYHYAKSSISPYGGLEPVDNWFSYAPTKNPGSKSAGLVLDKPAYDLAMPNHQFGQIEEEIIVIGERQRRDFMLVKPDDELTGPRALDAFQPYIPLPGATCTYKNLCYDLSQPPLRETLTKLARLLFGD